LPSGTWCGARSGRWVRGPVAPTATKLKTPSFGPWFPQFLAPPRLHPTLRFKQLPVISIHFNLLLLFHLPSSVESCTFSWQRCYSFGISEYRLRYLEVPPPFRPDRARSETPVCFHHRPAFC